MLECITVEYIAVEKERVLLEKGGESAGNEVLLVQVFRL